MQHFDFYKKGDNWCLEKEGSSRASEVYKGKNKREALREMAKGRRASGQPSSVRIRKENGQIQEERTYPRSADPSSSPG